ncbi:two-component regulator propeller domain-containing protein [Pedobacter sp. HMWF019]|uniref:ligand-binding sensor domain-containing protein n=1 Tax=Pedobacter sp. HMWF019 TaxID=2056856 RepID=UPI001304A1A2|nr:two-component regulator propeller domain-containing protein [Pedobacter sp. HMWF019]
MINKKNRLHLLFLCLTVFLSVFSTSAYAQSAYIQHYTTKDGLPSNNCYYTLQDSKGYIWIGTDAGVCRFDGNRFENFSIDDGLPDNQIIQIKEDKKGRIWFVAFNGEMSYFQDGKIYNSFNDKNLKLLKFNAVVISIFEDTQGRIWFGTNKNILFRFDGTSLTTYTSDDFSNQLISAHINEDAKGRIWVYSEHCIRYFENGVFKRTSYPPLTPLSYKTITNLKNNLNLYIDKTGLNAQSGGDKQLLFKIPPSIINDNLGYFYIHNTDLWLSNNEGVYHLDDRQKITTYLKGIPTVQVLKDTESNTWFTTSNGIYMLPREENRMYTVDKSFGVTGNSIKSVTKDQKNNLWLGLDYGHIDVLNKRTMHVQHIDLQDKKTFNGIKKLLIDSASGSVYFASDYGLGITNSANPQKNIRYLREANHSIFVIKDFSISPTGKLALALSAGVAVLNLKNKGLDFCISALKENHEFFSNRAYCTYYDRQDNLWFSNINGFSKVSASGSFTYYKNELLTRRINDIQQQQDGTLVLATDGYGLILIRGERIIHRFTQKQGLSSNICKKIFIRNNHIWVVTNNGLNRICLDGSTPLVEAFEYTNPLLKNDVNDLYIDKDTAYFATNKGLVFFHNRPHHDFSEAPKALISAIVVGQVKLSTKNDPIVLAPSNNKINFYYGAIDFQNQDISYRYRLKSNDVWTETKNRRIELSSLEPGKYSFELCAKTNNSSWGIPTSIDFELKARFWQSYWFLLILFVIAGFTFYWIAVVVTKRQKNKEQQELLLRNKILMLEQRALQAMMNPHFVFNVMNSIQHYINTKDTSSANKVLTGFAKLIRKNLEICTKSFISLEEELEYLELYLSLEKKRFGDKLSYRIQVDPLIDKDETFIPSMLLQPYIENAIWHGIMPMDNGGELKIIIEREEELGLTISIIDNGIGINNSLKNKRTEHVSKGMSLTQERVNLLNKIEANPIQILVRQNGISGTSVVISIPLH